LPERPVPNDPHVAFGHPQKSCDIRTGLLVVERHDDDRPFSLSETLYTVGEPFLVEVRRRLRRQRQEDGAEFLEKALSPSSAAPHVEPVIGRCL
jgi:hypothetical protein